MREYDPKDIEPKWQKEWEKNGDYRAEDFSNKPKFYGLMEFPYPSGDGLHTGHVRGYTAMDIVSRKRRMEGYNVLFPIGWDAFGLPTENYAIKTGRQPAEITKENTDNFRKQFKSLGMSFDWSREVNTTDPKYYKWTQWIFLQLLKHDLAYKAKMLINWCPKDKIGLANEEVVDGRCERCGTLVEKREKEQWMLAITKYADRLAKDLDELDFWERIKTQQRNWIGRSEGAEIEFGIKNHESSIRVFTTRPDTIFGATYMVLAPEHELVNELLDKIENRNEVVRYIELAQKKTDIERGAEGREKSGVELKGVSAINPATKEEIPVWIADYVLPHYGTGAIMAVPAHDQRDYEFAKKYGLSIKYVISPFFIDKRDLPRKDLPFVERKAVNCYLYDPKKDQYLFIKWKDIWWNGPVTGGVEKGESLEQAGRREIHEESGYKNVKFIRELGSPIRVDFYHHLKKENRRATFHGLLFELENEDRDEIDPKEFALHDLSWVKASDAPEFIVTGQTFFQRIINQDFVYTGHGKLVNSQEFTEVDSLDAREKIIAKFGEKKVTYKLRDWVFSRQRYWGEPIPVVHCPKCGIVPVPESELPVVLPEVERYEPTDTGESPLAAIDEWVNTKCPKCGGSAKRETDTMPNWAGSSWYFLRYIDPDNDKSLASKDKLQYWMPVDWYNGGMEHTTLHLLYSRFWNKFLFDIGAAPTNEPYQKRTSHGLVLAEGGEKMSKSKGNVINPDSIVERFGGDTLRLYEMFMGPFDQAIAWSESALVGPRRFLERVWKLQNKVDKGNTFGADSQGVALVNRTIKKVSEDIETLGFNTAVSSLMIYANALEKHGKVTQEEYETLLKLLAPFAPHITEELWHELGHGASIHDEEWPKYDRTLLDEQEVVYAIQVNGKVRSTLRLSSQASEKEAEKKAVSLPEVVKWLDGKDIKKVIVVPKKVVNIVTT